MSTLGTVASFFICDEHEVRMMINRMYRKMGDIVVFIDSSVQVFKCSIVDC